VKTLPILALCLLLPTAYAQERTAAGNLATEASWAALQNRIDATNGNVNLLRADMEAMKRCAAKGKVHAPTASGVDGDGCKSLGGLRWYWSGSADHGNSWSPSPYRSETGSPPPVSIVRGRFANHEYYANIPLCAVTAVAAAPCDTEGSICKNARFVGEDRPRSDNQAPGPNPTGGTAYQFFRCG